MSAPEILRVTPCSTLRGTVRVPGSKSATNRALLLAAIARGRSTIRNGLDADDTRHMVTALRTLGIGLEGRLPDEIVVSGTAGRIPAARAELFLGNAGTAMRFLAAAVALGEGAYVLDGEERMRQRPIGDLAHTLRTLGARVGFHGRDGFPPLEVSGGPLRGGFASLRADRSSQFTSALLMIAPCTQRGIELELTGAAVSHPYVEMTVELMARFSGPDAALESGGARVPGGGGYRGTDLEVEGDASAAAALFAAAAITGGSVTVRGLRRDSRQPDMRFPSLLEGMGCRVEQREDGLFLQGPARHGIEASLAECPDLAPALAAVALFAASPTRVTDAGHLRFKESDRIGDLAAELRRLGAAVEEHPDGFTVRPRPLHGARLDPHRDHRLAMAFAVAGLRVEGVEIEDPGCVAKSFPDFFEVLDSLRG